MAVSVGPHDHVKPALRELGVEERFWGVRLRPGKPTWFGVKGGTLAFGLPGNPVSAMVTFQLFARPALAALQGASPDARRATRAARRSPSLATHSVSRRSGSTSFRAGRTGSSRVPRRAPRARHVLTSMVGADGLALIEPGEGEAAAGERVEVELL